MSAVPARPGRVLRWAAGVSAVACSAVVLVLSGYDGGAHSDLGPQPAGAPASAQLERASR